MTDVNITVIDGATNATTTVTDSVPATCPGNIVGGNMTVQNNTAATQVFNNTVTNDLQCHGNTSITGGGNVAGKKQGQCASF